MSPASSSLTSGWSDDRVTVLSKLWMDGLTASQIAERLGVTRNAVIGKVHRLGLSGRGAPSAPRAIVPRQTRQQPLRRAAPSRPAKRVDRDTINALAVPDQPGLIDDLVDLGPHACRWPIGDPKRPGFSFCGRRADRRYCAAHAARAVRPGTAWRADRDPVVTRALAGLI